MSGGFHPWRRMRHLGPEWRLEWVERLPWDVYGFTDWATRTIYLRSGLSSAERRCTIAHEVEHVLRGPASHCRSDEEEALVDAQVSRLLLPSIEAIGDAMVFHRGRHSDVAADLWVDDWTLDVRLDQLHPSERHYLTRRMRDLEHLAADE